MLGIIVMAMIGQLMEVFPVVMVGPVKDGTAIAPRLMSDVAGIKNRIGMEESKSLIKSCAGAGL